MRIAYRLKCASTALVLATALCCFCAAANALPLGRAHVGGAPAVPRLQAHRRPSPAAPGAGPWLRVHRFVMGWGFQVVVVLSVAGIALIAVYSHAKQHGPYPPDRSPLHRFGCLALLAAIVGGPVLLALAGARVAVSWFTWSLLLGVVALSLVNRVSRRCSMCARPLAFGRDVSARDPSRCIGCELVGSIQPSRHLRPTRAVPSQSPPWSPSLASRVGDSSVRISQDDLLSALFGVRSAASRAGSTARPFAWQASPTTRPRPAGRAVMQGDALLGKTCPYCQTKMQVGESALACPRCGMPHHLECWQENGGCTVYGCELEPPG
ncbi:MAG: RING finger protein [Armatimonadota bacterium]